MNPENKTEARKVFFKKMRLGGTSNPSYSKNWGRRISSSKTPYIMNKTLLPSKGGLSGSVSLGVESMPHWHWSPNPIWVLFSEGPLTPWRDLPVPRVSSCYSQAEELWQAWSEHIYTKDYLFIWNFKLLAGLKLIILLAQPQGAESLYVYYIFICWIWKYNWDLSSLRCGEACRLVELLDEMLGSQSGALQCNLREAKVSRLLC